MKKVSKCVKFGKSKNNPDVYVPVTWLLDDVEVTEMEYYGITPETTIDDIGDEPADMLEFQEWKMKKSLIEHRDGSIFSF